MSRELWRAIGEKKQKLALEVMKGGHLDVNMKFAHAWTCLHAACERGYVETVRKLLEMGASPDVADWSGETCLHSVAEHGYTEIARILLAEKVQHPPNKDGSLPLHMAARKGRQGVLKLLLERFPDSVNTPDHLGKTPLHVAAENGHLDVVKMLVTCGGRCDVMTNAGETPSKLAELNAHFNVAKYMV